MDVDDRRGDVDELATGPTGVRTQQLESLALVHEMTRHEDPLRALGDRRAECTFQILELAVAAQHDVDLGPELLLVAADDVAEEATLCGLADELRVLSFQDCDDRTRGHGMTHLALATESPPQIGGLSPGELRVRADWLADGTYVVFVAGEVDLSTAPALATSLAVPTLDRARSIVVDLSTCTFMDASGLMALVGANERLSASGSRLALVISGQRLLRAFDVTGLGHAFAIHASLTAALAPPAETWVDEARRRVSIRSANEQLERSCVGLGSIDHERFFFICECGDRACGGLLQLSVAEYKAVREHAARFAITPNHENPEVERVVEQNGRFAVVETVTGLLSKPARETNPRWQRGEPW